MKTGFLVKRLIYGLEHNKTYKMTCLPREDSDQSGHLPSLISLFCTPEEGLLIKHTEQTD